MLAAPLAAIRARFPQVRLHMTQGGEKDALEQLDAGEADLVVVSGPERPVGPGYAVPLYRWDLVGVAPLDHPIARMSQDISLTDLAEHPLVTYESSLEMSSSFARAFAGAEIAPQLACVARDSDLIKTFVRAGLGVGLLAEMAVGREDSDLRVFPLHELFPTRTAWAVVRGERPLGEPLVELLRTIAPHLDRQLLRSMLRGAIPHLDPPPLWAEVSHLFGAAARLASAPTLRLVQA